MSSDSTSTPDRNRSQTPGSPNPKGTNHSGGSGQEGGKGFLEARPGQQSPVRAMSLVALVASIAFGALALTGSGGDTVGIYITLGLLLTAFAPKTVRKFSKDFQLA